jgi:ABC-type polysaccharide/polyol phosphate transport system ATPase subunit
VGVIGSNGAGKTTLLRLLAGQLLPDEGEIRVVGNSAAMIDLTAGFQMTASGRRNIFLRGAMLGRSKEEIASTYDEIVDFAELGDAIDAPVSTFSSGMLMRLAFSIMISMKPDVLFIDEILSVGDFHFRQKCLARIRELRERAAFVLVSHSMADIKLFCNHVIVLNKGEVAFEGEPEKAIGIYEEMKFPQATTLEGKRTEILKPQFHNEKVIEDVEHFWCDEEGEPISQIRSGETLYLRAKFKVSHRPRNLVIGVPVWTEEGGYVTGFSTELQEGKMDVTPGKMATFLLKIPNISFNPGTYLSNLSISDGLEFLYRGENMTISILPVQGRYWGVVTLPHSWQTLRRENMKDQRA